MNFGLPDIKNIENDILTNIIINSGISFKTFSNDPHINFIQFLTNSFNSYKFKNTNLTIYDFLKTLNLNIIFKIINNYNVFVCNMPAFVLYYLDEGYLKSVHKNVQEQHISGIFDIINKSKIVILYTTHENYIRVLKLDDNLDYLGFNVNERIRIERRKKLMQINDKI